MSMSARVVRFLAWGVFASFFIAQIFSTPAAALIISSDANLSVTTQNPAEIAAYSSFSFWDNIGWRGESTSGSDGSAIYLGNSWVLAPNHVRIGKVRFGETTYFPVVGSGQRIGSADLLVFRLQSPPDLPSVTIHQGALSNNDDLLICGTGLIEELPIIEWKVATNTVPYVWDPNSNKPNASGYAWSNQRVLRWGSNEISDASGTALVTTDNFLTKFDYNDTTYEAQLADKDSGASTFINNGGQWELTGLGITILNYSGQPDRTAVDSFDPSRFTSWGGNESVFADLTQYRDAIVAATPYLPVVILADIAPVGNPDGIVDGADLGALLARWKSDTGNWAIADLNQDGIVDGADLGMLLANWKQVAPTPSAAPLAIPEPATLALLLSGAALLMRRRNRSKKVV